MRTLQLIIALILVSTTGAKADYRPLKLYYMILTADKILNAEIIKIDKTFFYAVSLDSSSSQKEVVKVYKFIDWTCASRFDTYQIGQRAVLFLRKKDSFYSILSAGGEGEIPIIQDSVSIPFSCLGFPHDWAIRNGISSDSVSKYRCKVGRKTFVGIHVSAMDLLKSIPKLQSYFQIPKTENIKCSDFVEKKTDKFFPALAKAKSVELLYLLCFDFYEDKEKYCH